MNGKVKRILFLANYAPLPGESTAPGHHAEYHRELFGLLCDLGYEVQPSQNALDILKAKDSTDYIFSLLNRVPYKGSEILPTALAEYVGIPYLGCSPHIRAVADDKYVAKLVAKSLGIPTAKALTYSRDQTLAPPDFDGPYFIKPRSGAASKLVNEDSIQESVDGLFEKVTLLAEVAGDVLIEEYIDGTNVSVPIIGGLPPVILPPYQLTSSKRGQVITERQKRRLEGGINRSLVNDSEVIATTRKFSALLCSHLDPIDYLRVEFRVRPDGKPVFTEFNVCAHIASSSGFAYSASKHGLSHKEMLIKILNTSFARQEVSR